MAPMPIWLFFSSAFLAMVWPKILTVSVPRGVGPLHFVPAAYNIVHDYSFTPVL